MAEIWTVRGVPGEVQKAASEAARAAGMKLGAWVTMAVQKALASGGGQMADNWQPIDDGLAETVRQLAETVEKIDTREIDLEKRMATQKALEALEARVAKLEGQGSGKPITPRPAATQRAKTSPPKAEGKAEKKPKNPEWFRPNGAPTEAGMAEMRRRRNAGQSDREIARELGVSHTAVGKWLKKQKNG